jgi:hypothetical protein
MPNLKFSFADAHVKMREGGWSREVTQRELPIATALAGVNLRLTSGGVYASCIGTGRLSGHSYWHERRVSPPSTMTDIISLLMLAPATSGALGLASQSEASLMSFRAPPSAYPPASPRTQWLYVGLQTEPPENWTIAAGDFQEFSV